MSRFSVFYCYLPAVDQELDPLRQQILLRLSRLFNVITLEQSLHH